MSASLAALVEYVKVSMSVVLSDGDLYIQGYVLHLLQVIERLPGLIGEAEVLSHIVVDVFQPPIGTFGISVGFVCMGEYFFFVCLHGFIGGCRRRGVLRCMS